MAKAVITPPKVKNFRIPFIKQVYNYFRYSGNNCTK